MWDFKCMRGRFSKLFFFSWQSIFFSASFLVRIALTGKGWNSVEQGWNKLGHIRGDASEQFRWSGWAILGRQRARPLSVSFLFRTSGKETEVASPLGMEKYGRFDFSPWKPEYLAHNRPELMMAYADVQFSLFRFQFHALLRSGEPLFPRWLLKLLAKVFFTKKKTYFYPKKVFWFTFIVKFFRANLTCDTHSQNSNPPWAMKNMGDLVFHPEYIIIRQKIGQNPWWHMLRSTLVS